MVYNGKLVSPQKAGLGSALGDFRDISEGGLIEAPRGNPNYSSLSNTPRVFYRTFTQTQAASQSDFSVTITGTGTLVSNGNLGTNNNNFSVFFKIPQTSSGKSTGYMDLAANFQTGQTGDNDGCFDGSGGSLDTDINGGATNLVTFGTQTVDQNEFIVIKIVADKTWNGNIDQVSISW